MITQKQPLFLQFFQMMKKTATARWGLLCARIKAFWETHTIEDTPKNTAWPPLEEMALTPLEDEMSSKIQPLSKTRVNKKLVLAETIDKDNANKLVVVEVEFFPPDKDPYVADLSRPSSKARVTNYTQEGEDPNLRITHYPPTNRIH